MGLIIRPVDLDRDLEQVLAVREEGKGALTPPEQFRRWLDGLVGFSLHLAGEEEGRIVAVALVSEASFARDALAVRLRVLREHRGRGLGRLMWARIEDAVRERSPAALEAVVLDDDPASRAWAERRGFRLFDHQFRSQLDLETFDASAHQAVVRAAEAAGIRFEPSDDLYRVYRMYGRMVEAAPDVVVVPPRDYLDRELGGPDVLRLVAVDGDRWVGLTILQQVTPELAWNAITGVVPSHRGRRLARALKVLAAEDARRRGVRWIATRNNARNAPMLAVNEALGYQREFGEWRMRKELRSG